MVRNSLDAYRLPCTPNRRFKQKPRTVSRAAGMRGQDIFHAAFDDGLLIRATGDTIALSPPLIISEVRIEEIVGRLRPLLRALQ